MPSRPTRATDWFETRRLAFLRALRASGNVTFAARVAGCPRQHMYDYRKILPSFADEWQEAIERHWVDFGTKYTRADRKNRRFNCTKNRLDSGADSAQDDGVTIEPTSKF